MLVNARYLLFLKFNGKHLYAIGEKSTLSRFGCMNRNADKINDHLPQAGIDFCETFNLNFW